MTPSLELRTAMQNGMAYAVTLEGPFHLFFFPSSLFANQPPGLFVGCQEGGFFLWNGLEQVDPFELVTAGFPFNVSASVAEIIGEAFPADVVRSLTAPSGQTQPGKLPSK